MTVTGSDDRLARVVSVINGKGGVGKCAAEFERICDPETGVPMTLAAAVQHRLRTVLSYRIDDSINRSIVSNWIDSGIKPVVRIELASGRTLTVTPHHPMLMPDGWRRADEIKPGETVAAAGRVPAPEKPQPMIDEQVDLLAILLAEGCTSTPGTYYSTMDVVVDELAMAGAATLGCDVRVHKEGVSYRLTGGNVSTIADGLCMCGCGAPLPASSTTPRRFLARHGGAQRSQLIDFRIDHGLDFVLAKNKSMPEAVYRLPQEQLARFLGIFWMCDGYVSPSGTPELVLASEQLVRAFQHLLLRFGIQSRVAFKQASLDGRLFDAWKLTVYAHSIPEFAGQIPLWERKQGRVFERATKILATGGNPNVGSPSLTPELWERIRSYAPNPGRPRKGQLRVRDVATVLGWEFGPKVPLRPLLVNTQADGRDYLSKKAMRAFVDVLGGRDEFQHLISEDIFWDRVVAVVDAGEEHVYDLTVPGPANFVVNDLVAHNTSVTANVSGQLATAGYKVLAADLDLSGNLSLDLGYGREPQNDGGKSVVDAVWNDGPLNVIRDVRENLDVIAGGRHLEMLGSLANTPMADELPGGGVPSAFAAKLAVLAENYDIVLIDGAPGNPVLQDMALTAARYILIPTKTDPAGWDGLRGVGPRAKKVRKINPKLTYLGVVLFGHSTSATRVGRATRAKLDEVSDTIPVFETYIRHSESTGHDSRSRGQLAHELAKDAAGQQPEILAALRERRKRGDNVVELPIQKLSETASGVAGDYQRLAREVLVAIAAAEQNTIAEEGDA